MAHSEPALRVATPDDAAAVEAVMKQSTATDFPQWYDQKQTESAVVHVAHVDPLLLADGTYYILEVDGEAVACGGWSRRGKLYTGSGDAEDDERVIDPATEPARVRAMFVRSDWTRRGLGRRIIEASEEAARAEGFSRMILVATLPGVPLYEAYGFRPLEHTDVTTLDDVTLACVVMDKPIEG
ncbi:MAG: GNAT family N-acetyltransferase [Actinobacteria bacterium]|nr:GNAT family N-acetyltransferase [Actinomycetota bacterium]